MVNCAYKTENSQCQHKNVHTKNQIVTDKLCQICQFRADETDPNKVRAELPVVEIQPYTPVEVAVSLGKSALKHGRNLLTGRRAYVPQEVAEERLKICQACPHMKGRACEICSCNLPRKTRYASEVCPIHKWGEWTEPVEGGQ